MFDPKELLTRFDNDLELIEEVVDLFDQSFHEQLECLRKAADSGDYEGIYQAAHSIKGSACNFPANKCTEIAEKIETLAFKKEDSDYLQLADNLSEETVALIRFLKETIDKNVNDKKEATS